MPTSQNTVTIAFNSVKARLMPPVSDEARLIVSEAVSYTVEGHEHMNSFKFGSWDGRSSFYDWSNDTFPAGLVRMAEMALRGQGYNVRIAAKKLPEPLGPEWPKVDGFGFADRYDYQPNTMRELERRGMMIARVATGGGKCLGKDTPVLMYDGSVKMVQDVVPGDQLMGPDSKPRNVLTTCVGTGQLYRVIPKKGDPYVVNDAHILSLQKTSRGYRGRNRDGEKYPSGEIVNINVEEFLNQTKTFRHIHKGWRTGVDFESQSLPVDPYLIGVLIGDGSISGTVSVTTMDAEIADFLAEQARLWGLHITKCGKKGNKASTYYLTQGRCGGYENSLMRELRSLSLEDSKHFPLIYKTSSRSDRLSLLAGIIDTDGYWDGKGYYLTQKSERIIDDVIYVARSLGFAAYKRKMNKTCANNGKVGEYFSTVITGEGIEQIPVKLERRKCTPRKQKKDVLRVGIDVESAGMGNYYGFEIDGDHLFLLGDFTVTHNTRIAKMCTARIGRKTLFVTTRTALLYQMKDGYEDSGMPCGVVGDSTWEPNDTINVGMIQTLAARLEEPEEADQSAAAIRQRRIRQETLDWLATFEFLIGEEAHESAGESYFRVVNACKNARYRLALTATPFMKEDAEANMRLHAAFGPIGIDISEKLLIERKVLAKPIFKYVNCGAPSKLRKGSNYHRAVELGIVKNDIRNGEAVKHAKIAKLYGLPVLTLVQRKEHGRIIEEMLTAAGLRCRFIFGESSKAKRDAAMKDLSDGKIDVLIGSTILDVGVDVPVMGMLILLGGGKGEVVLRQRIGRVLREKKLFPNFAFIVDFTDAVNKHLFEHANIRRHIVESTPGFVEGILKPGQDFDFEGLGFEKKHLE